VSLFKKHSNKEVTRINRVQSDFFSELIHVFDPPLPEGVPQRLDQIVASGGVQAGDVVLDVGAGTGVLIPYVESYHPKQVYACDLSKAMLDYLGAKYPLVEVVVADVREIALPAESVDVIFLNASYPNIADKHGAFLNLSRMLKPIGRLVISHPLGKSFIDRLKDRSPFPLDDFPDSTEAETLLTPYGLAVDTFIDESELYLLVALKKDGCQLVGSGVGQDCKIN